MSHQPDPILVCEAVTRTLPGPSPVTLVRDIDLAIGRGEFVAITGPSGSGKSSLLYLLGLLDRPTSGRILLSGEDTTDLDDDALAARRLAKLGFVFQFHFLLPEFTALANVVVPMRRLGGMSERDMQARGRTLLESLNLGAAARKRPGQLSGGERQRVAIARALANSPAVILADEPTGNLDTRNAATVFDIFHGLAHDHGTTIIVVTHDLDLARRADRRVVLVDGSLVVKEY
ncbi:MAG: ABC transporter ATP-binding protein [Alphaproteobacteria bacterium]